MTWKREVLFHERVKRIGLAVLSALLLVLAVLLLLQVRQNHAEEGGGRSSSTGETDHRKGIIDTDGSGPRKPSKASQRRPHQKAETTIPLAEPVPGQPGFVYHPKSRKIVDVRGIPAGLMVQESGAMFVIPKMGYIITAEAYNKAVWNNFGAGLGAILSGESETGTTFSFESATGPAVVSCRPLHWETRWDDGTPYVPEGEAKEEAESYLE